MTLISGKTHAGFSDYNELIFNSICVTFKQPPKNVDLVGSTLVFESHKNDASMRASFSEYLLAKIFVVRNQNPVLIMSFLYYVIVINSPSLIKYRKEYISLFTQPCC